MENYKPNFKGGRNRCPQSISTTFSRSSPTNPRMPMAETREVYPPYNFDANKNAIGTSMSERTQYLSQIPLWARGEPDMNQDYLAGRLPLPGAFRDPKTIRRELGHSRPDNIFPMGLFQGESITKTDFINPTIPKPEKRTRHQRYLDLPPFVGETTSQSFHKPPYHQGDYKPYREIVEEPYVPVGHRSIMKSPRTYTKEEERLPSEVPKHSPVLCIDYQTSHQDSYPPPPENFQREMAGVPKKRDVLLLDPPSDSYKLESVTKTDFSFFRSLGVPGTRHWNPKSVMPVKELLDPDPDFHGRRAGYHEIANAHEFDSLNRPFIDVNEISDHLQPNHPVPNPYDAHLVQN